MANNQHHHNCPCCCGQTEKAKVEQVRLPDGRQAERHVTQDENGNEVVEIFAEEQRPLKLEERIVRESKRIVAKETREVIKDGEVDQIEVRSLEPEVPLQIRERIGVADHAKLRADGDYVRKEEIGKIVSDSVVEGVVAGLEALMEQREEPVVQAAPRVAPEPRYEEPRYEQPAQAPMRAQSVVEDHVAEKKKNDGLMNGVLAVVLIAQVAFFGYIFFVM